MSTDPEVATDPLEDAGREVALPEVEASDVVRERFHDDGTTEGLGRLATLAIWWAQVRGDAAAPPPERVVAVDAATTAPMPGGVRRVSLLEPRDAADDGSPDAAVARGLALADALADDGTDLALLVSDSGLAGRALAGFLMGLDPIETNGWQTGDLDDDRWMTEVETVRDLQFALRGLRGRPIAMMRALDHPGIAAATAFVLRCAARRTPVVLDGPGAAAAALLAMRCSRPATQWWLAAEVGDTPLHERTLTSLGLTALTRLDLRVEDGTASAAALALLGMATRLLTRDAADGARESV